jgi:hypothetical protein
MTNSLAVSEMDPVAPGNPFLSDAYRMGTYIGTNVAVMFEKHPHEQHGYIVVVNTDTGERIRVTLDETIRTLG